MTTILWLIMALAQAQTPRVVVLQCFPSQQDSNWTYDSTQSVLHPTKMLCGVPESAFSNAPPFDVSPVERKLGKDECFLFVNGVCQDNPNDEFVRQCADKSRFLLMSEDGKWHCLALGRQP